jgi:hypothetical protein
MGIFMESEIGNSVFKSFYAINEIGRIEDCPGLYSVLCYQNGGHQVIDVGESGNLREELENKRRRQYWDQDGSGKLAISVYYTFDMQQSDRKRIQEEVRSRCNLIGNERSEPWKW